MQQKNDEAGNLQEKFLLYECAKCDKRFPYHYSFKDLAKLALPSCHIYVFIVCLNASALKNTKPVPA